MGSITKNFVVSICTVQDVPGMVQTYLHAFASDPIASLTFPPSIPPSEMNRWLTTRFTHLFSKSYIRTFKIVDPETNQLVSFLRWSFPHVLTGEEKRVEKEEGEFREKERKEGRDPKWPTGARLEICDAKFGEQGLGGCMKKYVREDDMYVAGLLATEPEYQRKGLGKMLLKHVLDIADREGRKAYIEATDAGWPLYNKLDFKDVDVVYVDLSKWGGKMARNRVLVRDPQPVVQA